MKEYEGLAFYRLSFLWYSAVCFAVTYLTGLIVSVLWLGDHRIGDVDSRLLFKIGYCLPDRALNNSRKLQDEQQQLNQVDSETARENGTTSKPGGDMEDVEEDTEGALLMTTRM